MRFLNLPALILCNSEDTELVAKTIGIHGEIKDTNTGHQIVDYPNKELVKIIRQSCIDRINNINQKIEHSSLLVAP